MSYGNYPDHKNLKKALVIQLRHLGDALLSTPVFSCLKQALPNIEIDAYVAKASKELLENNPDVSNILTYDPEWKKFPWWSRYRKELQMLLKIKKAKYDLVINLTDGDRALIIAKFSKANVRTGFDTHNKKKNKIYTHVVKHPANPRHTVEKNLDHVRRIGIFPELCDRKLFLKPCEASSKQMREILQAHNFLVKEFILIHPTSRWKFKCWPIDKNRTLIEKLIQKGNKVILTSGKDEQEIEMIRKISEGFASEDVLNLAGKTSIKQLASLIHLSNLLICVDSLPLHIASAFQSKVVVLFGPTHDVYWGPWRNPNSVMIAQRLSCRPCLLDGCGGSKMSDCLQTLNVDRVFNSVLTLLSKKNSSLFQNLKKPYESSQIP